MYYLCRRYHARSGVYLTKATLKKHIDCSPLREARCEQHRLLTPGLASRRGVGRPSGRDSAGGTPLRPVCGVIHARAYQEGSGSRDNTMPRLLCNVHCPGIGWCTRNHHARVNAPLEGRARYGEVCARRPLPLASRV